MLKKVYIYKLENQAQRKYININGALDEKLNTVRDKNILKQRNLKQCKLDTRGNQVLLKLNVRINVYSICRYIDVKCVNIK